MNLVVWIATGLLTVVALTGGLSKTLLSKERLDAHPASWTPRERTPIATAGFVKSLGVIELLAAVGLIAPAVLGIATVMVPVTAVCWALLMVGAMITHGRLGQFAPVALNGIYCAIAIFVAYGRFFVVPLMT